jgi:hypothetical protein
VFQFSESYVDMLVPEEAAVGDDDKEKEGEGEGEEEEEGEESYGVLRSSEEFFFRAFDPRQKGTTAAAGRSAGGEGGGARKRRRRRRGGEEEREGGAFLHWEHVLEGAQTVADEAFAHTHSHMAEVSQCSGGSSICECEWSEALLQQAVLAVVACSCSGCFLPECVVLLTTTVRGRITFTHPACLSVCLPA